jgi:flavodoxin
MPKVVVVYLNTSGNTKAMADVIVEGFKQKMLNKI